MIQIKKTWAEHHAVAELWIGTLILAMAVQLILIFLPGDKIKNSLGLWLGTAATVILVAHMERSISRALDLNEKGARAVMWSGYMIRYLCTFILLVVSAVSGIADPICVFVGLMLRKGAAYIQPLTHKISERVCGKEVFFREMVPEEEQFPEDEGDKD